MSTIKNIIVNNEVYDIEDAAARSSISGLKINNKDVVDNPVLNATDVGALANTTTLADLPSDETHRLVSDAEKAAWSAKYDKPSAGIPKNDLTEGVKSSLDKADSALQSFSETDPTVPSYVKSITEANISSWSGKAEISDIPTVESTNIDFSTEWN